MMDDPPNNSVYLHLAKLLDQHLLRDARYRPFEFGESQQIAAEQMEQDYQLPLAFENLERLLYTVGGRGGSPLFCHTF